MKNFSYIKHRIKSVSDTRKITGAMETISVAKMRKAAVRYENNKAYFSAIRETISNIILYSRSTEHKVFAKSNGNRTAYIVIASDKGLAGGFNHTILEHARETVTACENARLFTVGQVCHAYFAACGIEADGEFADASFDPDVSQAAEMSERMYSLFESGQIDSAYIIYTAYGEHGKMSPEKIRLLPFDRDAVVREKQIGAAEEAALHELIYEPSADAVLEKLLPQYLTGIVYGALIQSSASEHSQRRAAMNNATRNASEILADLTVEYNRARQEAVTGEMIEIVTAANGVSYDSGK